MKKINYILLFFIFSVFTNALTLPANPFSETETKENRSEKFIKDSKVVKASYSSKVSKQKRPKKPKCIPVIIPAVSNHVFNSFYNYSDYSVHAVGGNYTLLLPYSNGKRGPPSDQA